ncbi:unnamed protein product [Urochloa humidicola]
MTTLLLLASSQCLVHVRMVPRDHPYVHAVVEIPSSPPVSQDLLQEFTAPPTPPLALTTGDKPEIATDNRRQIIQVVADGSVPSPGVGHH